MTRNFNSGLSVRSQRNTAHSPARFPEGLITAHAPNEPCVFPFRACSRCSPQPGALLLPGTASHLFTTELSRPSFPLRVCGHGHGQMSARPFLLLPSSHCGSALRDNVNAPVPGEYEKIKTVGYCAEAAPYTRSW